MGTIVVSDSDARITCSIYDLANNVSLYLLTLDETVSIHLKAQMHLGRIQRGI